jgi:hypothetical protein
LIFWSVFYFITYLLAADPRFGPTEALYGIFCFAVGLACFVTGTWHYLRRVEP